MCLREIHSEESELQHFSLLLPKSDIWPFHPYIISQTNYLTFPANRVKEEQRVVVSQDTWLHGKD